MKKYLVLLFLVVICNVFANPYHAFFVTISEIEYNAAEKTVEISIKIFTDDLEKALNNRFSGKANLNTSQESPQVNTYLQGYLVEKFGISVNNVAQTCQYIGKEKEDDATWCYLEVKNVAAVSNISVKNTLLMELYESQNNIVHVKVRGKSKSMMLKRNAASETLSF